MSTEDDALGKLDVLNLDSHVFSLSSAKSS
jgi:hypothetical protein